MTRSAWPAIWSVTSLRALDAIHLRPSEVVYAFVSLGGAPSTSDEVLLDDEERRQSRRFVRRADCTRFVLAHVALRLILSRTLGVEPATVFYERGVHGKPRLGPGLPRLEFNLSHSGELGVVAVARDRSVGVDLEYVRDLPDALEIADAHFSVAERHELRSLRSSERRTAFFNCWTRKEAVIKAGGEGLGRKLDSFDVDLSPGSLSALKRYDGRLGRDAGITVRDVPAPPGYVAAAAVVAPTSASVGWRELSVEVSLGATARS